MNRFLILLAVGFLASAAHAEPPSVIAEPESLAAAPEVVFALSQIQNRDQPAFGLTLHLDPELGEQAYRIAFDDEDAPDLTVTGGDAYGLMVGLLELAEAVRLDREPVYAGKPFIRERGLKMSIPLDGRALRDADRGTSAIRNIETVWDQDFWRKHLDRMAEYRFNVLGLVHHDPFTSMVDLRDGYPGLNLEDVAVPVTEPMGPERIAGGTVPSSPPETFEIIKKMTIEEKIDHWRWVMRYAEDRGIDVHVIISGTGPSGDEGRNELTAAFLREAVKRFVLTYPDLAGMGITPAKDKSVKNPEREESAVALERWAWQTFGEGVADAMADPAFRTHDPDRTFPFVFGVGEDNAGRVFADFTRKYPGPVSLGFSVPRSRLYASPKPPFRDQKLRDAARTEGLSTWMDLNVGDPYTLRQGDPDDVRALLKNLPPEPERAGFYLSGDGYVWGRTFGEKYWSEKPAPRRLEIDKHGYRFMMWGRLAYNPGLGRDFFETCLAERFGNMYRRKWVYDPWAAASRIVPLVHMVQWRDHAVSGSVETCMSVGDGYRSVNTFIAFGPPPQRGLQSIATYVRDGIDESKRSPIAVANKLDALALLTEHIGDRTVYDPRPHAAAREFSLTHDDVYALAHLGRYYADKLRGATVLHAFRVRGDPTDQQNAIRHLEDALKHWGDYAEMLARRYEVRRLPLVGYTDWTGALRDQAANDIAIARAARHDVYPPAVDRTPENEGP